MSSLKIIGGRPLKGFIHPMPNKNSILKIIPACILADESVTLHNVPKSSSVRVMLKIFRELGGKISYQKNNTIRLNPTTIDKYSINQDLAKLERASFIFLGPLLARFFKAEIGDSGGCKLGNRPLDTMFQGLSALGVNIDKENGYRMNAKELVGNDNIWLLEASVTGTENIILTAVKAKGRTVIYNAACEPHTQDLCNFLVSLGAQIEGIGTNRLIIDGVKTLQGGSWSIIPDHIDIGGFIVASAITDSEITIKNAIPRHMTQILRYFEKINLKVEIDGDDIHVPKNQELKCRLNVKENIDKIPDQPWPGFPVDLIPQSIVLASQAKGTIKIFSNMYETQLFFISELLKLKADIILADSHQVMTFGPSKLQGASVDASSILQGAHAILIAALSAQGTTIIRNSEIISRRYPNIVERLNSLGADISVSR